MSEGPEQSSLNRIDVIAAASLFALALSLRLVFLSQIESVPFLKQPVVDGLFLDSWAREIAAGDWWGSEVFYQAPGYPYFLASIYSVFGDSLWRAHQIQMGVGSLSCVFMYLAASRFFDRRVGVVAGVILAMYPPALFFDSLIQKAGLGLLLICVFLFLVARFQQRPSIERAVFCGISLAALGLTRENGLVFLVAVPLWIGFRYADVPRRLRLAWVASFLLGAGIILSPVALRNYAVGGSPVLTSSNFGTNFYIGNHPGARGLYSPLIPGRESPQWESLDARLLAEAALGRSLSPGEVSSYWLGKGLRFVRDEPLEWLSQLGRKALLTINSLEVPDSQDIHAYADASPLLRALLSILPFGALVSFAMAGIILAWPRGRDVWVHLFLPGAFASSVVLFFVFARYRFPLAPLLLPVAAFGVVEIVRRARALDGHGLLAPAVAIALTLALCRLPVLDVEPLRSASAANMGVIAMWDGDLTKAERYLEEAEAYDAESRDVWFQFAALRYKQGRFEEAKIYLYRLIEREENDYRPHALLAAIFREQGRLGLSRRHRITAARLNPESNYNTKKLRVPAEPVALMNRGD